MFWTDDVCQRFEAAALRIEVAGPAKLDLQVLGMFAKQTCVFGGRVRFSYRHVYVRVYVRNQSHVRCAVISHSIDLCSESQCGADRLQGESVVWFPEGV
jgi:hypothetical protein